NVDIECARGISIFYNEYPIIGINENDSYSAKSFTIIHELVHILKRSSNFCNDTYNSFSYNSEEVFCNAVAGEVLVPIEYLLKENSLLYKNYIDDNIISILSNKYCVSKEVILRRLLDNNYIHKPDYDEFILKFKVEVEKEKAQQRLDIEIKKEKYGYSGIPRNIGRETYDKNGLTFSNLLYDGYANELFSKKDIAGYLGIKQKHIVNFFKEVSKY
ncbi:MAG: ImmA/IrrE family metallo-endopeptidase, partial [Eubacteriaceae bacterium]